MDDSRVLLPAPVGPMTMSVGRPNAEEPPAALAGVEREPRDDDDDGMNFFMVVEEDRGSREKGRGQYEVGEKEAVVLWTSEGAARRRGSGRGERRRGERNV